MIKLIQTHFKKKRIQAKASIPKEVVMVNKEDIQRKLAEYKPETGLKKANFQGPSLSRKEFEGAV
jgi:predicted rRNA methylase YqxC with S4 and FtsJ domains